jgi:hypothetical protein
VLPFPPAPELVAFGANSVILGRVLLCPAGSEASASSWKGVPEYPMRLGCVGSSYTLRAKTPGRPPASCCQTTMK